MSKTKTSRYDVTEHLRTPEEMAAYLEACFEEANGDAAFIAKALGDIARAKGMAQVARDAGLSRESLYKALSGNFLMRALATRCKSKSSHGLHRFICMKPTWFEAHPMVLSSLHASWRLQ